MAVDLLSYTGNLGLGQGSNAGVSVSPKDTDLNVINKASENAMLLNHQDNVQLFQQKVADRNMLQDLIAEGKVQSGAIDAKDRSAYDEAEKASTEAYNAIKGANDTKGIENYRQKVLDLKNVANMGQARWVELKKLDADIAKETLKSKRDSMIAFRDKQAAKPIYEQITPYQQLFDFNKQSMYNAAFEGIGGTSPTGLSTSKVVTTDNNGKIKTAVTQTPAGGAAAKAGALPKGQSIVGQPVTTGATPTTDNGQPSAFSRTPEVVFDWNKLRDNTARLYTTDETQRQNQDYFVSAIESGKLGDTAEIVDYANKKIQEYDNTTGQQVKPFIEGVDFIRNPQTGQIKFNMPVSEAAAKLMLADVSKFKTGGETVFNKDEAAALENERHHKATEEIGRQRAKAYSNLQYKKGKAIDQQFNPKQVFDEIFTGKMDTYKTESGNYVTRVNAANLSDKLKKVLGIDPINQSGDFNLIPSNIKYKGKLIDEDVIQQGYPNWLNSDAAKKIKESNNGKEPSVFDYIYSLGGDFDVEVGGTTKELKDKNGQVTQKGGKLTRSNRLQSLINQSSETGVKGKDILKLLSENTEEPASSSEELSITNNESN